MKNKKPDYIFVGIQILLFIVYAWISLNNTISFVVVWRIIGLVFCLLGIYLMTVAVYQIRKKLTMLPTPVKNASLITTGVFKYIRHPIYSGIFLITFGYACINHSFDQMIVALLILLLFEIKSDYEEIKLSEYFPAYESYKFKTDKFFPLKLFTIKRNA